MSGLYKTCWMNKNVCESAEMTWNSKQGLCSARRACRGFRPNSCQGHQGQHIQSDNKFKVC